MPKPYFEGYRQEAKKQYEGDESSPSLLDEILHQIPESASTFMTRIRQGSLGKKAAKDERHQVLNPRVTWGGSIDCFEVFGNNLEGHKGQSGAGYLFDPDFQTAYLERGTDCFVDFLDAVSSAFQIKKDTLEFYGALLRVFQGV
jgi:hypothetical protein